MPSFEFKFFSKVLGKSTAINVILPEAEEVPENGWKNIYLLHGWSEDHTAWMRFTSIERYANKRKCAVIMPDCGLSFYNDMAHGLNYFTYLTEELPEISARYFRISRRREDNFIGGLSMGGCGAVTTGLRRPDLYSGIICLSASNFPTDAFKEQYENGGFWPGWMESMKQIYGDVFPNLKGSDYDAYVMADKVVKAGGPYPKLFHYMGLEETDGLRWAKAMEQYFKGIPGDPFNYKLVTYHGIHNWDSWDAVIEEGMDYVGLCE